MQNCNQLLTKKEANRKQRCKFIKERVGKIKNEEIMLNVKCKGLFSDTIAFKLHFPGGKGRDLRNRGVHLRLVTGDLIKSKRYLDLQVTQGQHFSS